MSQRKKSLRAARPQPVEEHRVRAGTGRHQAGEVPAGAHVEHRLAAGLGPPRQDSREGPARRLQFANSACILDVYFYPPAQGQAPLATYTTARVPDGRDAERNSCISALRLKR